MSDLSSKPAQRNLCVGLVAHVDAGKTTLAEAMLYLSGTVKKLGRVDHRSSFLDTHSLERQRGITIFSKQAMLDWTDTWRRCRSCQTGRTLSWRRRAMARCSRPPRGVSSPTMSI